MHLVVYIIN